jgi:four helix bundle protein
MDIRKKSIRSFKDLDVFQRSYKNSITVNKKVVPQLPGTEKYDLADQLRRSSKAVPRLIAEGYGKRHQKRGFQKYIDDALTESNETQVGLAHAKDLYEDYVDVELCEELISEYEITSRQLYRLRESWQNFKNRSLGNTRSKSNLASTPKPKSYLKGVSLIELLLVVAILLIIFIPVGALGSGFLARIDLDNASAEIASFLRTSQINAMASKGASRWGVNVSGSDITLFVGDSYASRDQTYDQVSKLSSRVSVTAFEVVFDKVIGDPNTTQTINLANSIGGTVTITVNEVGIVDVN